MPRVKKNPNALTFTFVANPEKALAKTTLTNYKNALNNLAEFSRFEHERDEKKPLIQTKADLETHVDYVLSLLKEHIEARLGKTTTLAAIFYIIGRQSDEKHPYVQEFRKLYYTDSYKKKLVEEGKLIEDTKA